jgi:hypothetical protein
VQPLPLPLHGVLAEGSSSLRHRNRTCRDEPQHTSATTSPPPLEPSSNPNTPTTQQKTNLPGDGSFAGVGGERGRGFEIQDLRFRVQGQGFSIRGMGFYVYDLRFRI